MCITLHVDVKSKTRMNQNLVWIILSILWKVRGETCNKDMAYYEELISKHVEDAENYVFPKDNGEFFRNLNESEIIDFGDFDYIIVGAGPTGAILAHRLTEVSSLKVLLVEAGGEENDFNRIPSFLQYVRYSNMNWGYYSTPQSTCCLGMIGRKCKVPRGKALGGTTVLNTMMYVRGNKHDYDTWEALGNHGWSYQDVLPYFIKTENSHISDGDTNYHGKNGLLNVEYSKPSPKIIDTIYKGNIAVGRKHLDINGRDQMGFTQPQQTTINGVRDSANTAFLAPIRNKRKNLYILTHAYATKILVKTISFRKYKAAEGIEFIRNGKKYRAKSRKEVIVCAGTINSPQLLMLSGIGPRQHLKQVGIKLVKHLPAVGNHFRDHPEFMGLVFRTNYTTKEREFYNPLEYYLKGKGPYTMGGNSGVMGFINTKNQSSTHPDIEYVFILPNITIPLNSDNLAGTLFHYYKSFAPITDFRIYVVLLHEKSHGNITLKSNDPKDFPNINLNMLSDKGDEDIETIYNGVQFVLNIIKTEPFRKMNTTLIPLPICKEFEVYTKQYWYCAIRHLTTTIHHPVGTNRMGRDEKTSVVNSRLQVHGIKKLRVADCSIFPTTTSGHTNAPAIMVGEKLADMIL